MRAFCLECGVAIHQGVGKFKADFPRVLADESDDLSARMRHLLEDLFEDLKRLGHGVAQITKEVEACAAKDDRSRRLMTVPGIGALGATAIVAAVGDGKQFKKARDMAAWLGLTPREHSTRRQDDAARH